MSLRVYIENSSGNILQEMPKLTLGTVPLARNVNLTTTGAGVVCTRNYAGYLPGSVDTPCHTFKNAGRIGARYCMRGESAPSMAMPWMRAWPTSQRRYCDSARLRLAASSQLAIMGRTDSYSLCWPGCLTPVRTM